MPRLGIHMAGLGNTATIGGGGWLLISGSVKERNGQKRSWTTLSVTPSAQPGSFDSSTGDLLEAFRWDLMKVTFDENSCLGILLFSSFARREESQHHRGAPAGGDETPSLLISSTGHTMQRNPGGCQEPSAPKTTRTALSVFLPS